MGPALFRRRRPSRRLYALRHALAGAGADADAHAHAVHLQAQAAIWRPERPRRRAAVPARRARLLRGEGLRRLLQNHAERRARVPSAERPDGGRRRRAADAGGALRQRCRPGKRHAAPLAHTHSREVSADGGRNQPDHPGLHLRRGGPVHGARAGDDLLHRHGEKPDAAGHDDHAEEARPLGLLPDVGLPRAVSHAHRRGQRLPLRALQRAG